MKLLILDFLLDHSQLSNEDFDRLASMMLTLRQKKLDLKPRQTRVGAIIYQFELPKIYTEIKAERMDTDSIRMALAYVITPLIKDKLVSRLHYDMAIAGYEVIQRGKVTELKAIRTPARPTTRPVVITLPLNSH